MIACNGNQSGMRGREAFDPPRSELRGGSIRDRTPLVPADHDKIGVMRLRAGRDGTGRISDADIDVVRELAPAQPSANLALKTALGPRPPCFDDRSRTPLIIRRPPKKSPGPGRGYCPQGRSPDRCQTPISTKYPKPAVE
jgi:hypothetical protein